MKVKQIHGLAITLEVLSETSLGNTLLTMTICNRAYEMRPFSECCWETHNEVDLAREVCEDLVRFYPAGSGRYTLPANVFASCVECGMKQKMFGRS
jgi:hypothetical protein